MKGQFFLRFNILWHTSTETLTLSGGRNSAKWSHTTLKTICGANSSFATIAKVKRKTKPFSVLVNASTNEKSLKI